MTTVLVTHDQEEALDVADRIAVLNHGRIEQVGDPVSLYERPANDFVMSFLGSVARLGGQLVRPHDIVLERDRRRPTRPTRASRVARRRGRDGRARRAPRLRGARRAAGRHGERFAAQVTRAEADRQRFEPGETVHARAARVRPTPRTPSPRSRSEIFRPASSGRGGRRPSRGRPSPRPVGGGVVVEGRRSSGGGSSRCSRATWWTTASRTPADADGCRSRSTRRAPRLPAAGSRGGARRCPSPPPPQLDCR